MPVSASAAYWDSCLSITYGTVGHCVRVLYCVIPSPQVLTTTTSRFPSEIDPDHFPAGFIDSANAAQDTAVGYLRTLEERLVRSAAYWSFVVDCYVLMGDRSLDGTLLFVRFHLHPLTEPLDSLVSTVHQLDMVELQHLFMHSVLSCICERAEKRRA